MTRAVFPGTFDPITPGHLDVAERARHLFDELVVLVAVNGDKQPTADGVLRAIAVRAALPPDWRNVTVDAWRGLTADYCHRHDIAVIVRGVRNPTDVRHEQELAAMNESLGVTTLLLPTRPGLAAVSSTAARARLSPP
ncbi:phosphopantetheine adenylyltransferase [Paractinoplanes abujensis]|uniref:Pantetheine-phosphate adenylyltransferase n=1 Tax=Paractinoplanes abujensis TaxID=882441 RepID=A0A7W7CVB6_9ACTN|nr:pantetheine-phosphate adenylyltransferase [Actinoplanes abujensis]MBB4694145.1 pantetheine-phosphate adenylyltransferase [Actinoplanes abujensis]GID20641.1 phosphopantetheine adenylyltransferase [Actinoplanes abujensis]